jgi:hypothetical protein
MIRQKFMLKPPLLDRWSRISHPMIRIAIVREFVMI